MDRPLRRPRFQPLDAALPASGLLGAVAGSAPAAGSVPAGGSLTARRTFLVECYLPSLDRADVAATAARAEATAQSIGAAGDGAGHLAYLGAMLVAQDEVVFHAFSADDAAIVDAACRQAAIPFERIVESESVPAAGLYSASEFIARMQSAGQADEEG